MLAGYEEIDEGELSWLHATTGCSHDGIREKGTLEEIVETRMDKAGKKRKIFRYFLDGKDPMFAMVAGHRNGLSAPGGTSFFGARTASYCGGQ